MPFTAQSVVDQGFAKSSAARPETLNTPTELVDRINQCLREAFNVMSREQPALVGVRASVAFDGTGWPRPSNCQRVLGVFASAATIANPVIPTGQELNVVPFDDQLFCVGSPSLTELGQSFVPVGQLMDPTGGSVAIIYARTPVVVVTTDDTIDALFPDQFQDFLNYDMAAYLAEKDQREQDQQTFLTMKNGILSLMIDWCQQQTYSVQQRFPLNTPPLANTNGGRQQPEGK